MEFDVKSDRPAARIQAAFDIESAKRNVTGYPLWIKKELEALLDATNKELANIGKEPVTIEDIHRVERMARGRRDYRLKVALYCEELVLGNLKEGSDNE